MLGLRFTFHIPQLAALITEGHMDWAWGEAEKAGVPIYVLVRHALVYLIDGVAQRYPGLKLVMDHLALNSKLRDAEAFREFDKLLAIAKRPNVAAKASALPCYSTDKYPYKSLHGYIRPGLRRVRPAAPVLGHRPFALADTVPAARDDVDRRDSLAHQRGQGMDHGPRRMRLAALGVLITSSRIFSSQLSCVRWALCASRPASSCASFYRQSLCVSPSSTTPFPSALSTLR
jgi:hypothetical protein